MFVEFVNPHSSQVNRASPKPPTDFTVAIFEHLGHVTKISSMKSSIVRGDAGALFMGMHSFGGEFRA